MQKCSVCIVSNVGFGNVAAWGQHFRVRLHSLIFNLGRFSALIFALTEARDDDAKPHIRHNHCHSSFLCMLYSTPSTPTMLVPLPSNLVARWRAILTQRRRFISSINSCRIHDMPTNPRHYSSSGCTTAATDIVPVYVHHIEGINAVIAMDRTG